MATLLKLPGLATRSLGRPTHHYRSVGSTQDTLREHVARGATPGTAVLADRQERGRGRQGRAWVSLPGPQIFASVFLRPSIPVADWPILNIAAALALTEAIDAAGRARTQIKWPNDVFIDGKKAAGILSEVTEGATDHPSLLLGLGVNLSGKAEDFPPELKDLATTLEATVGRIERLSFFAGLLGSLEEWIDAVAAGEVDAVRSAFSSRWIYKNRPIEILTGAAALRGVSQTIDRDGALLLEGSDGRTRRVLSSDALSAGPPVASGTRG